MAKRNLVDDINNLGTCLFREYKTGDKSEFQHRRMVRGRQVILVIAKSDTERLRFSHVWGVRVLRVDASTDKEIVATVNLVGKSLGLVSTPRQGSHKQTLEPVVDLGPAPKPRTNLDGPNVLQMERLTKPIPAGPGRGQKSAGKPSGKKVKKASKGRHATA